MKRKIKLNKKVMKEFNKDPLKWICLHIGQEIELPKKPKPEHRWFILRFDNGKVEWKYPDFIEEVTYKELRTLAVEKGTWQFASKLVNWINGGKYGQDK